MMHKAGYSREEKPYCFPMSSLKFQGHMGQKIASFDPNLAFPDCNGQLEFTDWFEMMHNAWCSIEEVPCNFSRSSIKFEAHTGWKIDYVESIWVRY